MKTKTRNLALALLLAACMALFALPTLAAELTVTRTVELTESLPGTSDERPVVSIAVDGGAPAYYGHYSSVHSVLSDQSGTFVITLLADQDDSNSPGMLNVITNADSAVTLNLNGKTLNSGLVIQSGNLTVTGAGSISNYSGVNIYYSGGNIALDSSVDCLGWMILNESESNAAVGTNIVLPEGVVMLDQSSSTETAALNSDMVGILHKHSCAYAASGATITESCPGCKTAATLTLAAPQNLTYDGAAKTATVTGSLFGSTMPEISYANKDGAALAGAPVGAGDYTASIAVGDATATIAFTIKPKALTAKTHDACSRVYDATALLENVPLVLDGVLSGDSVSGTADFQLTQNISVGEHTAAELHSYDLSGEDAGNYSLAPYDVSFTRALITQAEAEKWTYDIATPQSILVGSGLSAIVLPASGTGIGSEAVEPTAMIFYIDAQLANAATDAAVSRLVKGEEITLYYRADAKNYKSKTGSVTLNIVEHEHVWSFEANGNVIAATCSGPIGTCPVEANTVTFTLAAPIATVYDGNTKTATVIVAPEGVFATPTIVYGTADGAVLTSAPIGAGDYTASITVGDTTAAIDFTIAKAAMTFGDSFAVKNGDVETTAFTYGDTITVLANPEIKPSTLSLRAFTAPAANEMALFLGDVQISDPVKPDTSGLYAMTVDTTDKLLPAGESTITAKYVGTENLNDYSQSATITVKPKELTVVGAETISRVHKTGLTTVAIKNLGLDGVLHSDEVFAADGMVGDVGSDEIDSYLSIRLPETILLSGAHASYYTAAGGGTVDTEVEITTVDPDELETRVEINENFTDEDIPQELKAAGMTTVAEIENTMDTLLRTAITESQTAMPIEDTKLYDVELQYWDPGHEMWIKADAEHFPANGRLKVALPLPEGTSPDIHDYFVTHMFTSSAFGKTPGDVEHPTVKIDTGAYGQPILSFEVTGLSPIMVGWAEKEPVVDLPDTGDSSSLALWLLLMGASLAGALLLMKRRHA